MTQKLRWTREQMLELAERLLEADKPRDNYTLGQMLDEELGVAVRQKIREGWSLQDLTDWFEEQVEEIEMAREALAAYLSGTRMTGDKL